MKIFEIGTGYTSIPAKMGAATEIVVEELTKSMLKNNIDVQIIDIKDKERKEHYLPIVEAYMPQFFSTGAVVKLGIIHKVKRVLYSVSLTHKLKKLIKSVPEKEEIILHFHNQYNLYFFLKLTTSKFRERVKIAYTNHSYIWQGDWNAIKDTISKKYFQEVFCCRNADKVFVLNEKTAEHLTKELNVPSDRIVLIANGVNTEIYSPIADSNEQLLKDLNYEGKTVFFQAGSVCPRKNQKKSIELLLPILKNNPNALFLYAGGIIDDIYKQEIDAYSMDNGISGQVVYVGELKPGKELNIYYNVASAFVFPSTSEGFSLVILEAMSAGVPVLVDANSGLKLPNNGDGGCLCYLDNNDFLRIVECEILVEENLNKQKQLARSVIEHGYSWDKIAKDYIRNFN